MSFAFSEHVFDLVYSRPAPTESSKASENGPSKPSEGPREFSPLRVYQRSQNWFAARDRIRVWHDRTGQFRTEAAFLGFNNGKFRLHKTNGVIVEVPAEKMSAEDMRFVEKIMSRKSKPSTPARKLSDDDVPLAIQQQAGKRSQQPKRGPRIDWFDFFLTAGCDMDDCTRYAASFERDKIDEAILPDITDSTMRSLGLREGDIIRVSKVIASRKQKNGNQLSRDEELTRQLQAEENAAAKSPPNLFTGPGGQLKANVRRGRPTPSKSTPPATVDLNAIGSVSDIPRTGSPQLLSPAGRPSSTPVNPPPRASSALATSSGFDDEAWTVRTKPLSPAQAAATARAPSAPPAAPPPVPPLVAAQAPAPVPAPAASTPAPSQTPSLAKTSESDIFDQLSRLSELRKNTAPPAAPTPPAVVASAVGFQSGLGVGSSPTPMGQYFQNQQPQHAPQPSPQPYNGPRGPFAPVPGNQSLLQPLIPTQTGFNSFIPTRAVNGASPFQNSQPSFLNPQPTGFPGQQSVLSQPTGFPGQQPMMSQPTGFPGQQPMMSQPTGLPFGSLNGYQPTGSPFGQLNTSKWLTKCWHYQRNERLSCRPHRIQSWIRARLQ